ncbi:MAG: GNAT family N-acetyltransferase [Patescibacteria group bacterium]
MEIRLARPKDVPRIVELYHFLSQNYQDNEAAIAAAIVHPATFVHVAVELGVILGTATLSVRVVPSKGSVGYIDDVVVDPIARGKRVAAGLMLHLAEAARQLECQRLELTSNSSRQTAIRLYEKLGFVRRDTNVYQLQL